MSARRRLLLLQELLPLKHTEIVPGGAAAAATGQAAPRGAHPLVTIAGRPLPKVRLRFLCVGSSEVVDHPACRRGRNAIAHSLAADVQHVSQDPWEHSCESAGGEVQGAQGVERCDPGQEAQELGTALGHLLLYVQLVANILGAPLLYEVPIPPQALVPTHTTVRGRMIA